MTRTAIPSMIIEDVELRVQPSFIKLSDPMTCDHRWEPHLWEHGGAYCPLCGSRAGWVNDPRLEASP